MTGPASSGIDIAQVGGQGLAAELAQVPAL